MKHERNEVCDTIQRLETVNHWSDSWLVCLNIGYRSFASQPALPTLRNYMRSHTGRIAYVTVRLGDNRKTISSTVVRFYDTLEILSP